MGYANYSYSYQEDDDEGTSTYANKKTNSKKSSKNVRDDEDEDDEELLEEELTDSKLYKLLTDKKYKSSSDPTKNYSSDEILEKMVEYVNILREKKGECELEMDDTLMEAAAIRAEEISDLYSHTRPDETRWVTVLDEVGYEAEYKGKNKSR